MGQLGDLSPEAGIAIGIIVGLCSTSIQSLGLTLQRKSHLLEEAKPQLEEQRKPYRRRRWQIGMSLFIISNLIGSVIQITTLPLPVLSTLQASGLVFNTAFATLLLHEPFTLYSFFGTILVCGGAVLIGIFGAVGEPAHDLQQLLDLLERPEFILWMAGTFVIVIATFVASRFLKYLAVKAHQQYEYSKELERNEASPLVQSTNSERRASLHKRPTLPLNIPVPNNLRTSRLRMIRGLSYALISGILSAHSLLIAKSAVELIVRSLVPPRSNQFDKYQSWLILMFLVFFALSQLYFLHRGLSHCSTSVLYPFVFCIYNAIAILDGLIYFNQSARLSALDSGLVALGTFVLLAGVLSLSWRLEDLPPMAPATAPGSTDVEAPLGRAEEPLSSEVTEAPTETSPLLERRARRCTQGSSSQIDQRPTLSLLPPHMAPPSGALRTPTSAQIWAELDDSDGESGKSLRRESPRSSRSTLPRSQLHLPRIRRRRGHTLSSDAVGQAKVSFADIAVDDDAKPSRRSMGDFDAARRSSAPILGKVTNDIVPGAASSASENQEVDGAVSRSSSRRSSWRRKSHGSANEDRSWAAAPKKWAEWFYTDNKKDRKPQDRDVEDDAG